MKSVILNLTNENIGGINRIFILPCSVCITPVRPDGNNNFDVSTIVTSDDSKWIEIQTTLETGILQHDQKDSDHGPLHHYLVEGILPTNMPMRERQFSLFDKQEFLILVKDNNGHWSLVGRNNDDFSFTGMIFTNKYNSGDQAKNRNQNQFILNLDYLYRAITPTGIDALEVEPFESA